MMTEKLLSMLDLRREILKLHEELEAEHNALQGDWFGRPRKRHHQIMGASRALKELLARCDAVAGREIKTPPVRIRVVGPFAGHPPHVCEGFWSDVGSK